MIDIKVLEYYNKPSFYQFMSPIIFAALEKAFLAGKEFASVPENEFKEMINKSSYGS